jgi:hypothetical protein
MAKEKVQVPLTFELGWQRQDAHEQAIPSAPKAPDAEAVALR